MLSFSSFFGFFSFSSFSTNVVLRDVYGRESAEKICEERRRRKQKEKETFGIKDTFPPVSDVLFISAATIADSIASVMTYQW